MASLSYHKSLHRRTDSRAVPAKPAAMPSLPSAPAPPAALAQLADTLRPRKSRLRVTAVALLSLVALSCYVVFFAHPSLSAAPLNLRHSTKQPADRPSAWQQFALNYAAKSSKLSKSSSSAANGEAIALEPPQELAALTAFMAALPQNVLPPHADPTLPLDPALVLDFDARAPGARAELAALERDAWARYPVVLFAAARGPRTKEAQGMLEKLELKPAPAVFHVDTRDDADVLVPTLLRLTGAAELPILLVGGHFVGALEAVRALEKSGELKTLVAASGATPGAGRRKKKKGRSA